MSSFVDVGNTIQSIGKALGLSVLEEELQEKGSMFRDFLTSRVKLKEFFEYFFNQKFLGCLGW